MSQHLGQLIVIDAIDGAGKSTAIRAMCAYLESQGKRVFDLVGYMQREHTLPPHDLPELVAADVLISAEPTHAWIGSAIREEVISAKHGRSYDGFTAAQAFSLDRQILFSRVILPFLEAQPGRVVIQDRGLISSLAYQPLQDNRITIPWLLSLPGNILELSRPPELLLLLRLAPEEAMKRLEGRSDKIDGHVYEIPSFQEQLALRYRDESVLQPYRDAGTHILEIDASQMPEQVGADCVQALRVL